MIASDPLVRLRFISASDTSDEEVDAISEALRAAGADVDVEASDSFIGVGEVAVVLAIVVALSEAVKAVLDLADRIKGKVGFTLDTRERPATFTANPGLPAGVGLVIQPDGRTETIETRSSSALDALQRLLGAVAS